MIVTVGNTGYDEIRHQKLGLGGNQ